MKNKITATLLLTIILLSVSVYAESDNLVYSLTLGYDGTALSNEGLKLIEGSAPERLNQPEIGFTARIIDFNGNVLHSFKFLMETTALREAPVEIFSENGTQIAIPNDTQQVQVQTEIVLVMPYFENAKSINILNENDQLLLSVDVSKYSKQNVTSFDSILIVGLSVVVVIIIAFVLHKRKKSKKTKHAHHKK